MTVSHSLVAFISHAHHLVITHSLFAFLLFLFSYFLTFLLSLFFSPTLSAASRRSVHHLHLITLSLSAVSSRAFASANLERYLEPPVPSLNGSRGVNAWFPVRNVPWPSQSPTTTTIRPSRTVRPLWLPYIFHTYYTASPKGDTGQRRCASSHDNKNKAKEIAILSFCSPVSCSPSFVSLDICRPCHSSHEHLTTELWLVLPSFSLLSFLNLPVPLSLILRLLLILFLSLLLFLFILFYSLLFSSSLDLWS